MLSQLRNNYITVQQDGCGTAGSVGTPPRRTGSSWLAGCCGRVSCAGIVVVLGLRQPMLCPAAEGEPWQAAHTQPTPLCIPRTTHPRARPPRTTFPNRSPVQINQETNSIQFKDVYGLWVILAAGIVVGACFTMHSVWRRSRRRVQSHTLEGTKEFGSGRTGGSEDVSVGDAGLGGALPNEADQSKPLVSFLRSMKRQSFARCVCCGGGGGRGGGPQVLQVVAGLLAMQWKCLQQVGLGGGGRLLPGNALRPQPSLHLPQDREARGKGQVVAYQGLAY